MHRNTYKVSRNTFLLRDTCIGYVNVAVDPLCICQINVNVAQTYPMHCALISREAHEMSLVSSMSLFLRCIFWRVASVCLRYNVVVSLRLLFRMNEIFGIIVSSVKGYTQWIPCVWFSIRKSIYWAWPCVLFHNTESYAAYYDTNNKSELAFWQQFRRYESKLKKYAYK